MGSRRWWTMAVVLRWGRAEVVTGVALWRRLVVVVAAVARAVVVAGVGRAVCTWGRSLVVGRAVAIAVATAVALVWTGRRRRV